MQKVLFIYYLVIKFHEKNIDIIFAILLFYSEFCYLFHNFVSYHIMRLVFVFHKTTFNILISKYLITSISGHNNINLS